MKEIVQIPMQVIEPIAQKDKRNKMKFEIRELKGRHDIYYVDEDKECFIIGCNLKQNAELIMDILTLDIDKNPIVNIRNANMQCKDCRYFEYDSVVELDGVPIIALHEVCNKWGRGCKSREDGYCFLFEKKE